jgi:hypothetical protein
LSEIVGPLASTCSDFCNVFAKFFTFIMDALKSKHHGSKHFSVVSKKESGEMTESFEEESNDGSSKIYDSCEKESFDEVYDSHLQ